MEDGIVPEGYKKTRIFKTDGKLQVPPDFGDYEIIGEIGSGGMGVIYKARHKRLNAIHALKVLDPVYAKDGEFVRNFKREAQLAAQLKHPNITTIHNTGEFAGFRYIAMEFVEGKSLSDLLAVKGRIHISVALAIGSKICDALEHAHNKEITYDGKTQPGIIHRDIKPENIMIEENGEIKLMDFGIARCAQVVDHTPHGTKIKGTVPYMSPEQLDGCIDIDHRTDIYSLGVVLYELVSGRKAFTGISRDEYEPLERLNKDIPKEIVDIVNKAMSRNRTERFASAFEMKSEIYNTKYFAPYRYQDLNALVKRYIEKGPEEQENHNGGIGVLKILLRIAVILVMIFLLSLGIKSGLDYTHYRKLKGTAEKAFLGLQEKIDTTKSKYKSMNLASFGNLLSQVKDSFTSEDFKSVASLCYSGSKLIDTLINNYRDSTWERYTTVKTRIDSIIDQTRREEINNQYVRSAKDRFDQEDYDSAHVLLRLAEVNIPPPPPIRVILDTLDIACSVNGEYKHCDVYIDGHSIGEQTPCRIYLFEGWHGIKLIYTLETSPYQDSQYVHITRNGPRKIELKPHP